MTATFVLDCSVAVSWVFGDETTPASSAVLDRLEDEAAVVPAHWFLEVTNVLAMAEKRKRITATGSAEFLALLGTLDIQTDAETAERAFAHLPPLCRSHGLTSYDAAYLELAMRRHLPVASLDDNVRRSAKKLGIPVLGK